MKSLSIISKGKSGFFEKEKPSPSEGEVLVKVKKVGYCGSDLNTYRGLNPLVTYPRVPGHEVSGVIEELGSNIPKHISKGMQVALLPQTACGKCSSCKKGRYNACKYNETLGIQRDGALTDYISMPWEKLILSEELDLDSLAILEPLAVGFHAAKRGRVEKNDFVIVFGCGVIGLGAIAGAAFYGAEVIAVDIVDEKLEKAKKSGAKYTINSSRESVKEVVDKITQGHGTDVSIEAVGLPLTFKLAVEVAGYSSRVVFIGYSKDLVDFDTKYFLLKELDILGSRGSEKDDFENVLEAIKQKIVLPEEIITHHFPFSKANEAIDFWANNMSEVTKIVIDL